MGAESDVSKRSRFAASSRISVLLWAVCFALGLLLRTAHGGRAQVAAGWALWSVTLVFLALAGWAQFRRRRARFEASAASVDGRGKGRP